MAHRRRWIVAAALFAAALSWEPGVSANPLSVRPAMSITIYYVTEGHDVCLSVSPRGASELAGAITWSIVGARSDGTPINAGEAFGGSTLGHCELIPKNGAAYGNYSVVLSYLVLGDDLPSVLAGAGIWYPGGDQSVDGSQ